MKNHSDRTAWDRNASFWDNAMGDDLNEYHRRTVRPAVMELLGKTAGEPILDVACGNGAFSVFLSRKGAEVTAFDFSGKMISAARERWKDSNVRFITCDATNEYEMTALGENKFTKAVSTMALMDIENLSPLAKALSRMLTPGGIFVFATQHPCFMTLTDRYMTSHSYKGKALEDQPAEHMYYHRSLQDLLYPFFQHGFMADALRETCFRDEEHPEVLIIRAVLSGKHYEFTSADSGQGNPCSGKTI